MKKVLFVVYQAPYGSVWPNEAFRTAFGMYAEDIEPEILLMDGAVVSIAKDAKPENLGLLSLKMVQRYIKKYELKVYAVSEDLERYNVKEIDEGYMAEIIPYTKLKDLAHEKDLVIFM